MLNQACCWKHRWTALAASLHRLRASSYNILRVIADRLDNPFVKHWIALHVFPKDPKQRETWLKSLGIPNLIPTNRTWICSHHFKEEDFYITQNETRRIKQGVVPFIERECSGAAALRICKLCLSLDVNMYQIKDHGLDKMYQNIIGIPPRTDAQNRLPMGICWECTARLQSAAAFRSKALFSDALLEDHLKNNTDLNIIDIQNIHDHQTNLKSSMAIQEVFKFNSHNIEEHAPNTFIKTEVLGIPNNEEIEVDVQHLVTDKITIKDERKNEIVIDSNFPDSDFKTEVDLIPDNEIEIGEEDTSFDDDFSDKDNSETVTENVYVNESRKDLEKVLKNEQKIEKVNFAANLSEIMQTNDDELMNLAKNLTSEGEDDDDEKSNASDDGGIKINLMNKTVRCVKIKQKERKKEKASNVDDGLIVKRRPEKKQPYVKPCVPIDENIFSTKMLSHEDLMREVRARRDSDKYKNAPYKCKVCFRGFPTQDKKERHVIKHSEQSGPIKCNICHVRMKTTRELRAHMKRQHTMEFICKLCPMVTRIRNVALGHMKYHAGNKYECPQCSVQFEKQTTFLNHLRLKHMSAYVCELCGYTFVNKNGVDIHKRRKHKFDAKTEFKGPHCDVCEVKFLTKNAYDRHLRLSSKHIKEDDPNRMSNNPSIKKRRVGPSTWNGVRRPVIHRKNETTPATNGPVTCEQCGVVLESLRVYAIHFRYAHPGINRTQFTYASTPYMCEHCGKFFLSTETLSCHMWVHTGQKLFQCDHCNKAFSMKGNLVAHMKQHENIRRTYDCQVCGKNFTLSCNLTRHMFLHTGLKPFKCDACEKKFRTSTDLRAHVDHVHLKKPRPKRVRRRANKCELPTLEY